MKLGRILKSVVSVPLSGLKKLPQILLEKPMNAAVKAALMSTGKKVLRTLLAVAAAAFLAALPAMQSVFAEAAAHGSVVEKAVFGGIVTALVGLSAFLERYTAVNKNGQ